MLFFAPLPSGQPQSGPVRRHRGRRRTSPTPPLPHAMPVDRSSAALTCFRIQVLLVSIGKLVRSCIEGHPCGQHRTDSGNNPMHIVESSECGTRATANTRRKSFNRCASFPRRSTRLQPGSPGGHLFAAAERTARWPTTSPTSRSREGRERATMITAIDPRRSPLRRTPTRAPTP